MKALFALFLTAPLHAQTLGGIEPFTFQDNSESWAFYNYASQVADNAPWDYSNSGNPEIYATFTEEFGVSLFADIMSSQAYFVGDYASAGIDTLVCDVFVDDLSSFSDLEFYILAGGTFYYSDFYQLDKDGWSGLENSLSRDQWYIFDESIDDFVPAELTSTILSDVTEVGLNFYPVPGLTDEDENPILDNNGNQIFPADGKVVALDNFAILPDLLAPKIDLKPQPNSVELAFTGIEGIQYTIQTSSGLQENDWNNVGSPIEITGPSYITVPLTTRGFFRILSEPFYIETP